MFTGISPETKILYIGDPEIILAPKAISKMINSMENRQSACGPVFNTSLNQFQKADLPWTYFNIESYLETADIMAEKKSELMIATHSLDPSCILYNGLFFKKTLSTIKSNNRKLKQEISHTIPFFIEKNALIHRFGDYYHFNDRKELIQLIPQKTKEVLDVGCAMGMYGKRLKKVRPDIYLAGVEKNPEMAAYARKYYDDIHVGNIETVSFKTKFDLINCGELLEHLVNPWKVLKHFNTILKPDGYLVLSIPNAGHWSIVMELAQGNHQYLPSGLNCISHLRWFTEPSICDTLGANGFKIDVLTRRTLPPTLKAETFIRTMAGSGFGNERSLRTSEFIIRAIKIKNIIQ
ncbi:class I SAM-dependent methyltransferase [Desulfamplus magnetovallimortis]|nr:class I SAM-dependent methyltransferase [Desulfamplus magnetovallimortis]